METHFVCIYHGYLYISMTDDDDDDELAGVSWT